MCQRDVPRGEAMVPADGPVSWVLGVLARFGRHADAGMRRTMCPKRIGRSAVRAEVWRTNGTSLVVFRAVLRQPGCGPGLHQPDPRLGPTLPRPRLPAPGAVPDAVVRDGRQQHVDQRRPLL